MITGSRKKNILRKEKQSIRNTHTRAWSKQWHTHLHLIEVLHSHTDDLTDDLALADVVAAHLHRQLIVRIHPLDKLREEARVRAEVVAVLAVRGHCRTLLARASEAQRASLRVCLSS